VFEQAIAARADAALKEADERSKAAHAVFQSVWKAAQPLFAENAKEIDACPVCETPLSATTAGSRETIRKPCTGDSLLAAIRKWWDRRPPGSFFL
jgi:hypothetical protein